MKRAFKKSWVLAMATGAALMSASIASAQYRMDTGHSNDASNRIGSGGINPQDNRVGQGNFTGVTSNDIVNGNVTGGKAFRGNVETGDQRAFRGTLASKGSDLFVRDSSGTPYATDSGFQSNAQVTRPFYGDSRGVAPPPGFVRTSPGNTGYVPSNVPDMRIDSDTRLGQIYDTPLTALPQPGQTVLPGPVDPQTNNTLLTMSPLYGVRQWNSGNISDQQFVQRYANVFGDNADRMSTSDLEINAMQRELVQAAGAQGLRLDQKALLSGQPMQNGVQQSQTNNAQNPLAPTNSSETQSPDSNQANPLPQPLGAPNNSALPQGQFQSNVPSGLLPSSVGTGEGQQARMLVPSAQQTAANAILEARFEQSNGGKPMTDVQRSQIFNRDLMAAKAAQEKGQPGQPGAQQPGTGQPGAAQPGAGQPGAGGTTPPAENSVPGPTGAAPKSNPPLIKSFAEGVKAKGLADVLKSAEDLMKQGKWFSAIEQYDVAQQVAPNNMLIIVGRANAELGGSYYGRAEADLRRAFTQDPAMLEGKYDLRTLVGDDRLQFLVNDLKDINTKNPTQSRYLFLLAYIEYNTGNERLAAGYLKLASDRAGAGDTFYSLVKKYWTLPDSGEAPKPQTPAPNMNK